jgi:hypothetical protein
MRLLRSGFESAFQRPSPKTGRNIFTEVCLGLLPSMAAYTYSTVVAAAVLTTGEV